MCWKRYERAGPLFPNGRRNGSWNLCCGTHFRLDQSQKKRHPAGTSTSRGSDPTNKRSVEAWPVLLLRSTRSRGEPMFADGRIFPLSTAGMVCGCAEWAIPGFTDTRRWPGLSDGKRGMVRAKGSASWTIDDNDAPDPGGGGKRALGGRPPAWRQPKGGTHGARRTPNAQGFPALGSLTPDE